MNIKEAKEQIKHAIIAYSTVDRFGKPLIPIQKQRPIFLLGAPGIGKTAIVEQIAEELDIALVSYSMTHHTRQSALGLPYIVEKEYDGEHYQVSEYTMSEIIASVYEAMETTGKKRGILFLDEINCISETLAPSMLQFLQYKTFGRHQVPENWIVVTAGNPPEFNRSVHEFDIVTWDRLKRIEIEPEYASWKEYALAQQVHPAITSYLDIKPEHFYHISTTIDGKQFVTARGWDDLSQMIKLYEKNHLTVDHHLIEQYLQDETIARDFSHYYQLFHKYRSDYNITAILKGAATNEVKDRARASQFDERLSLTALVISQLDHLVSHQLEKESMLKQVMEHIQSLHLKGLAPRQAVTVLEAGLQDLNDRFRQKNQSHATSTTETKILSEMIALEEKILATAAVSKDTIDQTVLGVIREELADIKQQNQEVLTAFDAAFTFYEEVFGTDQEMVILTTEMTIHARISKYLYTHQCPKYQHYNENLLFENRQAELMNRIDALDLLELEANENKSA